MLDMLPPHVRAFYKMAEEDCEGFWEKAALDAMDYVHWFKKWDKVFEWKYPNFKWYMGGTINACYSCLDLKVEQGQGNKAAFIALAGDASC